jgi:hypothetical protein
MEFTVERQKTNNQCSTCPNIDEWKSVVTIDGKTVISMHGYDPTDELTEKQAKLLSGDMQFTRQTEIKGNSFSDVKSVMRANDKPTLEKERVFEKEVAAPVVESVSLDDAKAALAELDNEVKPSPNQMELDALAAELATFEAIPTKQRTDKDRSEIKRIKNRINYLNRKA